MNNIEVSFCVNGEAITVISAPNRTLLDVLRQELELTGAKDGCGGEGECGACTVLMDGMPINSCLMFIGQAEGHSIETIEDLARNGDLHQLQKAFIDAGAVQCGYCTPGMILSAKALLMKNPSPNNEQIRESLSGNLCRCTGYVKIIEAVHKAAEELRHE